MSLPTPRPTHASNHCRNYSYKNTGLAGHRCDDPGGPQCAAGIDLTAPGASLKCLPDPAGERCGWREEFTDEERAAWKSWRDERMGRMVIVMAMIPGSSRDKKNRPEWGKSGSFTCPACTIGIVRWVRARVNGHVHAFCSTPDCFEVIE